MQALREPIILGCMLTLAAIGWIYGYKFFQLKNDILGFEWWLIGLSASCFFLYRLGVSQVAGQITYFLDLFSRLIGVPVIGALGVLKVTHGLHFTRAQEVWMFAVGLLVSAAFVAFDPLKAALPTLYLVFGIAFFALCGFMAAQAFRRGLRLHGWLMTLSVLLSFGVSLLQDFVKFEDENTAILINQLVIEHVVWSFACVAMFYCYRALHHSMPGQLARQAPRRR